MVAVPPGLSSILLLPFGCGACNIPPVVEAVVGTFPLDSAPEPPRDGREMLAGARSLPDVPDVPGAATFEEDALTE